MEFKNHLFNRYLSFLTDIGIPKVNSVYSFEAILFFSSLIIFIIVDYFFTHYTRLLIKKIISKSNTKIDDILYKNKVFAHFLHIITTYIYYLILDYIFVDFTALENIVNIIIKLVMDYLLVRGLLSTLTAINDIYDSTEKGKRHSIKSYIQVFQLGVIILGLLIAISITVSENIRALLAGLGAFAAIIMLIFKDSILGFIGGIQINANDMLRPGDWVTVPNAGADGVVIEISLTTVKIQNWDKTISTVPTYSLVSGSFHNWRGMEESGGRRIKRSINIDINSIKFCSLDDIEELKKFSIIKEYLETKEKEIKEYNELKGLLKEAHTGRSQTNIGVFRAYISQYLSAHESINTEMTFLVRQLQPTETGLPLEIYVFSKDKEWSTYEAIQADVFDHLFAIISEFGLRVFQNPSSFDFKSLTDNKKA